jgi:hypothetical protein
MRAYSRVLDSYRAAIQIRSSYSSPTSESVILVEHNLDPEAMRRRLPEATRRRLLSAIRSDARSIVSVVVAQLRRMRPHRIGTSSKSDPLDDYLRVLRNRLEHSYLTKDELTRLIGQFVASVPAPSPWAGVIGSVYTTTGLASVLGIQPVGVERLRVQRKLLSIQAREGEWLYPAAQLSVSQGLIEGVGDLLALFDPGSVDDYTLVAWLLKPRQLFEMLSAIQWLEKHGIDEHLETVVRDMAQRLAA